MTLRAYAKINIGLQIVRKREDGYHDIDSIFHRVDISDELSFARRETGITLTTSDPSLPTDESNLCVLAAKKLFAASGYDGGIHIGLQKQIPTGAGLGGGSSDAAATLKSLNTFLNLHLGHDVLHDIARTLGADVPYFLESGSAYAKGTGDILSYFTLDVPYSFVIVNPGIHVSTPWAYSNFRFNPSVPIINLQSTLLDNMDTPIAWVNKIRNDFEPLVFAEHEEVMRAKEVLYRTGAVFALMSGSGSTVFGMYDDETYAAEAHEFFGKRYASWLTAPGFHGETTNL